jgi:glycosyltransferase involved in cell wall biosynthesis
VNILIVTDYYPPDRIGGVGTIAQGLADAYRGLGHRVFVLTTGEPRADERARGVLRSARRLSWGVLKNNVAALLLIARERIDFVHLHQAGTTLFLLVRPLLRVRPRVMTSLQVSYLSEAREVRTAGVAGRTLRPRPGEYLERWLLAPAHVALDFIGFALSDVVTTVSADNSSELQRTYGRVAAREVHVVPNGVADVVDPPDRLRDPALEARLHGKVVVTYAGVFRARKRVANVVMAFAEVARRFPNAVLLIVGGGRGYEKELHALVRDLGVDDRVVFAGPAPADRMPYYLALTHVFCLLSSYEGMPMGILEAMHAGLPVVATNAFGQRELLADGAGLLVPIDDVPAAAAAIGTLVGDAELRARIGAAARERVRGKYSWDTVARQYLELAGGP